MILMNDAVAFAKMNKDAIIPSKVKENADFDIYANFKEDEITIHPGEIKLIGTGIASACTPKYMFKLFERGSTGTKGLSVRAGVIDSGYRGEWFVPINNTSDRLIIISKKYNEVVKIMMGDIPVTYYPYTKAICQAQLIEVPDVKVHELTYEELCKIKSERGKGALGSSGK